MREKQLIELDALIDNIDWDNDLQKWTLRGEPEDIPTVDAVPVVRCKDCRHRRRYVFPFSDQTYTKCKIWDGIPRPDDFCSYGERKNDDKL